MVPLFFSVFVAGARVQQLPMPRVWGVSTNSPFLITPRVGARGLKRLSDEYHLNTFKVPLYETSNC